MLVIRCKLITDNGLLELFHFQRGAHSMPLLWDTITISKQGVCECVCMSVNTLNPTNTCDAVVKISTGCCCFCGGYRYIINMISFGMKMFFSLQSWKKKVSDESMADVDTFKSTCINGPVKERADATLLMKTCLL